MPRLHSTGTPNGWITRMFDPSFSREIRPNSVVDPNEVAEVEALVEFVECKRGMSHGTLEKYTR